MTKLQVSERYQLGNRKLIHQIVDHLDQTNSSSPSRGPPPPQQIRTVTAIPPPLPPQQTVSMYPRSTVVLPSIPSGIRTSFSHSHHVVPAHSQGNYSNGHINQHGSMSREGSVSSDSGEGGPLSPPLKCELCGVTNFPSNKALQQVRIFLTHLN